MYMWEHLIAYRMGGTHTKVFSLLSPYFPIRLSPLLTPLRELILNRDPGDGRELIYQHRALLGGHLGIIL